MHAIRAFFRSRTHLALFVIALALGLKALVPAGYMVASGSKVLTVAICSDTQAGETTAKIVIPVKGSHPIDKGESHGKTNGTCAFTALAFAALGGADALLLASALLFILAIGYLPIASPRLLSARFLRPPLRGPPLSA